MVQHGEPFSGKICKIQNYPFLKCVFAAWNETKTFKKENFTLRDGIVLPVKEDCKFRKYVDKLNKVNGLLESIGHVQGDLKKGRVSF